MTEIKYAKQLDVRYNVDVFIAGGGPAGITAAVAAAREGKSVFIAEGFGAFGGAAVTMLIPAFMQFGNGVDFLAGGIGREIYDRLKAEAYPRFQAFAPNSIPVENLKLLYDSMIEECGAKFLFYTNVIDAVRNGTNIEYVICASKGSMFAVKAKIYIDCTGDGDLAYYAGAEYEYGDENGRVMATTLCGLWDAIDWSRVVWPDSRALDQAFADGIFTNEDRHLSGMFRIASETKDENGVSHPNGIGGSNAGHIYDIDGTKSESVTPGIIAGRRQLQEYRKYYQEYLTGFENTELVYSAPYLGIRESRRIVGDYKLVLDDFLNRAVFEDEIGRYSYPVDIHSPTNDDAGYAKFKEEFTKFRYEKGESYGIPYRVLTVKGFDNLLTAGRCISTDRYMQSSIRVMPGCFITGQAAGMAAAEAIDSNSSTHNIDVHCVQRRLKKISAFLPNYKE
jgi:hypothetical protein